MLLLKARNTIRWNNIMPDWDLLITDVHIATMADNGISYGLIKNGSLAISKGLISWLGPTKDIPDKTVKKKISMPGKWLTPALIDCHTHLVFAGNRAWEFEARANGKSYTNIANEGGGIVSTVKATRDCDISILTNNSRARLSSLRREGVGTIEIKSGYGLDLETEIKMLKVACNLENEHISIHKTFLGAHSIPPEYKNNSDSYIQYVCEEVLPEINNLGLIDAVDAYCEKIAFNNNQITKLFTKATSLGLPVKLHADQLSNSNGAKLAADFHALSADHLEYTTIEGVHALAEADCVAVLLPGAFMTLRETQLPPIQELRNSGVSMAVATDCNPGTSPLCSIRLAMALASNTFNLTPEECLAGVTREAAKALGATNTKGTLEQGKQADIAVWDIDHPNELSYWLGLDQLSALYIKGKTH